MASPYQASIGGFQPPFTKAAPSRSLIYNHLKQSALAFLMPERAVPQRCVRGNENDLL